ncbi:MAG: heavy metal-binding domain-containing protein [Deltaproteobacteria bacterium]|nr:heavy metal-binding domain-containing protein [Deltaproteobacteria bacterium]
MRRVARAGSIALLLALASAAPLRAPVWAEAPPPTAAAASTRTVGRFTCPQHPQVHKRTPGKCPMCGTTLVPVPTPGS